MHKATATRRILNWYRAATPEQLSEGLRWYDTAGEYACQLASEYGVTIRAAAGIVAALSPQTGWNRNKAIARELLASGTCGQTTANRIKALRIREGEEPSDVLGGLKVRAFYACIAGDTESVCVDRWAARVALGCRIDKLVSAKQYRDIADAYRRAARILGVPPRDVQAVTWVVIRAESGITD